MSVVSVEERGGMLVFDQQNCARAGEALAASYQNARPFPHAVIDDFLDPAILRGVLDEFPGADGKGFFDRDQERLKYQFHPAEIPGSRLRSLVTELNSDAMLAFLEKMTGIEGLIPDPYFVGGGLHETRRGGHLGIHADFNIHKKLGLERRINLLIYLNDDWDPSFGGKLELWDQAMTHCEVSVAPVIGRAVVFNTALDSFHGHPDPLSCPEDRSRRSIATYYYTASSERLAVLPSRTTAFKARPRTEDRIDWRIGLDHFLRDWIPPKLYRLKKGAKR